MRGFIWPKLNRLLGWNSLLKRSLAHIINSCIIEAVFPKGFKIAKVLTIFKKGDQSTIENHSPIYIIPVISNVFERVLNNQTVNISNITIY